MMSKGWVRIIASDIDYEYCIAELQHNGQLLLQLDRELGPDAICIAFPDKNGKFETRIPLNEFLKQIELAVEDLKR
jgi:hypothetical protein